MQLRFIKETSCFFLLFVSVIFISCNSRKKTVYFQEGREAGTKDKVTKNYLPVFKPNDLLGITIASLDLDAAKPFNSLGVKINSTEGGVPDSKNREGYLIHSDGTIDFPVLGKLAIAGLNREQAVILFKEKLKNYLADPIISIHILNYSVTVLGDVARPGTFKVENEKITLLEALGYAGDLNISAVRNNVLVIREENNIKGEIRVDLTSKAFYSSPAYYLEQNDVVYVEPNRIKSNAAFIPQGIGIALSVITIIITTLAFITR